VFQRLVMRVSVSNPRRTKMFIRPDRVPSMENIHYLTVPSYTIGVPEETWRVNQFWLDRSESGAPVEDKSMLKMLPSFLAKRAELDNSYGTRSIFPH